MNIFDNRNHSFSYLPIIPKTSNESLTEEVGKIGNYTPVLVKSKTKKLKRNRRKRRRRKNMQGKNYSMNSIIF